MRKAPKQAPREGFETWTNRAKEAQREKNYSEVRRCYQNAYFNASNLADSLWNFSKKVVGRDVEGLVDDRRREFADFVTQDHPRKMLQAARGSWKSSIAVVDYSAWLVGRDYLVNNGESRIRILLASETEELAKRNLRGIRQIMEWREQYVELAGNHRPERDFQLWGKTNLTSGFRKDPTILEPTISVMGLDTARTGFHYDVIICDDLEAERTSASRDLIDSCWEFYRLLLSILTPGGTLLIVGTRWHPEDIYAKIEDQNSSLKDNRKVKILTIPSDDGEGLEIGNLNFPNVLTKEELEAFRDSQGPRIFNCQYRLRPHEDEEAAFKKDWIRFVSLSALKNKRLNVYVTCDFAWTEKSATDFRRAKKPDFTVVETWAVDDDYHYHCLDWFRERCSKRKAVEELYRQYFEHEAISAIGQKYDRSQIADTIDQYGFEYGKFVSMDWIAYPAPAGGKKQDRILAVCEPAFHACRVHITRDMEWFIKEEYEPFPKGKMDGFDCICNVIHVASPGGKVHVKTKETEHSRRIKMLKAGTFEPALSASKEEDWRQV
jgi:hypothetical protein